MHKYVCLWSYVSDYIERVNIVSHYTPPKYEIYSQIMNINIHKYSQFIDIYPHLGGA